MKFQNITTIGMDFIDAHGVRSTTTQLVTLGFGSAIAIAWYEDAKLVRCVALESVDKTGFLDESAELVKKSIPIRFIETKLS